MKTNINSFLKLFKRCSHQWEILERYCDVLDKVVLVLVCTKCGKIKKIKI